MPIAEVEHDSLSSHTPRTVRREDRIILLSEINSAINSRSETARRSSRPRRVSAVPRARTEITQVSRLILRTQDRTRSNTTLGSDVYIGGGTDKRPRPFRFQVGNTSSSVRVGFDRRSIERMPCPGYTTMRRAERSTIFIRIALRSLSLVQNQPSVSNNVRILRIRHKRIRGITLCLTVHSRGPLVSAPSFSTLSFIRTITIQ